jgi:hypothetical protein
MFRMVPMPWFFDEDGNQSWIPTDPPKTYELRITDIAADPPVPSTWIIDATNANQYIADGWEAFIDELAVRVCRECVPVRFTHPVLFSAMHDTRPSDWHVTTWDFYWESPFPPESVEISLVDYQGPGQRIEWIYQFHGVIPEPPPIPEPAA